MDDLQWKVTYGNPKKGNAIVIVVKAPTANVAKKSAKVQARSYGLTGRCGTVRLVTPEDRDAL